MSNRIKTIVQVVKLMESPECVSINRWNTDHIHRGRLVKQDRFDLICDYGTERRICVDVTFGCHSTYIEVRELGGYDEAKHAWTTEGLAYRTEIENKRGRKPLLTWCDNFYEANSGYASRSRYNRQFSTHVVAGKLLVY